MTFQNIGLVFDQVVGEYYQMAADTDSKPQAFDSMNQIHFKS